MQRKPSGLRLLKPLRTEALEISLESSQAGQLAAENATEAIRTQLVAADARIAGEFFMAD